jgi:hypothetical protein
MRSRRGGIVAVPAHDSRNEAPSPGALRAYETTHGVEQHRTFDAAKRRDTIQFDFGAAAEALTVFDTLLRFYESVAVGSYVNEAGTTVGSAFATGRTTSAAIGGTWGVAFLTSPRTKGRRQPAEVTMMFAEAFLERVETWRANFVYESYRDNANVSASDIMEIWAGMDAFNVRGMISDAAAAKKRKTATVQEAFVADHASVLLAQWRTMEEKKALSQHVVRFDDPGIVSLYNLALTELRIWYLNTAVEPACMQQWDVKDWLRRGFLERSLLIYGRSGVGKTPLGRALCAALCRVLEVPHFCFGGTPDALPRTLDWE